MSFVVLVLRIFGIVVGLALVGVGVPLFIMPIPLGLIVISLGLLILLLSSTHAVAMLRALRRRFLKLDEVLRRAEDAAPGLIRHVLKGTRPAS